MSRGAYAGQPHSFACAMCRKSMSFYENSCTVGRRYRTTGRSRPRRSQGMNYRHWGKIAYEYECLDCGHVGWSRHPDVARRYTNDLAREQGVQTPDEVAAEDATWD